MVLATGYTSEEIRSLTPEAWTSLRGRRLRRFAVVTGDAGLRKRLESVGELVGWDECVAPASSDDLLNCIEGDAELVFVDVASPLGDRVNDSVECAEEMSARPGTLVVVCGDESSVEAELWARQLGVWVYLPGVSNADGLVSIFREALQVQRRERTGAVAC